jgi:hypothetical protein
MKHMSTGECPGVSLEESLEALTSGLWVLVVGGVVIAAWSTRRRIELSVGKMR